MNLYWKVYREYAAFVVALYDLCGNSNRQGCLTETEIEMAEGNGEWKGQMKQWVIHFEKQRTEDVQAEKERHTELVTKLDQHLEISQKVSIAVLGTEGNKFKDGLIFRVSEHKEYHNNNEHKWGTWTLFKKKPAITLLVGGLVTSGLAYAGYNLKDIINLIIKFAK